MTRTHDPSVVWWMVGAFLGIILVGVAAGLLLDNLLTALLVAVPLALLAAVFILSRKAERAAFAQVEGQPGGSGAVLNTLKRGWITEEQPVAVDPRTRDAVFRAVGRPGVVLVSEGSGHRTRKMMNTERQRLNRIIPEVPVHMIQTGRGEGQVPLPKLQRHVTKLKPALTRAQVTQVSNRISSMAAKGLPIPKGIDPNRARPDRKGMYR